jgi:hypothetical protein
MGVDGGQPVTLLSWRKLQKGELFIGDPNALPGTSSFLLDLIGMDMTRSTIEVWSDGLRPMYLPTGHLLFLRLIQAGANRYDAYVVPFDLSKLKVTGKELSVLEDIRYGQLAVSATGTLAYNSSGAGETTHQLTWVDRNGAVEPIGEKLVGGSGYSSPRVSPDGTRLVYFYGRSSADARLFVRDLATGTSHVVGPPATW